MPIFEAIRLALYQIRVQKLKSFFTLLGVMIGVMFLITVVSIVEGMSRYVETDFAARILGGLNTFTVSRRPASFFGPPNEAQRRLYARRPRIYARDIPAMRDALPAGTNSSVYGTTFAYANSTWNRPRQVQASAGEPDIFQIKRWKITDGRTFNGREQQDGARVAVIGTEVAEYFFPNLNPIGRTLRVGDDSYEVIGLIEKQGSVFGFSLDRLVVAPSTSPMMRVTNPAGDVGSFTVEARDAASMADAMERVREVMRGQRHLGPSVPDNFSIETAATGASFFDSIKEKLVLFGTALPAIGLVVGAMVIMNIMLVAVAERTREIGVRKALGARRRDIMAQFLIEAATLSVVGAAIGIALGILLAKAIAAVTPLPASVAPWSIAMALSLGAGVGIAAGYYPASRASRLDPITALRAD
jgi:putative ABC transport system permease protein